MFIDKDMQEKFLLEFIIKKTIVSLYLRNGIKMTGTIIAMTDDIIFFNDPVPKTIYKRHVKQVFSESHRTKLVAETQFF